MLLGNEKEVRERLVDEMRDLRTKQEFLEKFMESEDFEKLPKSEKYLMIQQDFAMDQYVKILDKRFCAIRDREYDLV